MLRNMWARILKQHSFKLHVRILAMDDLEGEGEQLESVSGEV